MGANTHDRPPRHPERPHPLGGWLPPGDVDGAGEVKTIASSARCPGVHNAHTALQAAQRGHGARCSEWSSQVRVAMHAAGGARARRVLLLGRGALVLVPFAPAGGHDPSHAGAPFLRGFLFGPGGPTLRADAGGTAQDGAILRTAGLRHGAVCSQTLAAVATRRTPRSPHPDCPQGLGRGARRDASGASAWRRRSRGSRSQSGAWWCP